MVRRLVILVGIALFCLSAPTLREMAIAKSCKTMRFLIECELLTTVNAVEMYIDGDTVLLRRKSWQGK